MKRNYNGIYENENVSYINFPLGGIGAGNYCISGTGAPNGFSLRNKPDIFSKPNIFAAVSVKGDKGQTARILEGQVPTHEIFAPGGAGNGLHGKNYGLPHFKSNTFKSRFPYAQIELFDESIPLDASILAWSPFIPGDSFNCSLPAATLEYTLKNNSNKTIEAVYYFCSFNFMKTADKAPGYVKSEKDGFVLGQKEAPGEPWQKGEFYLFTDEAGAVVNTKLFRGGWFDCLTMLWNDIQKGEYANLPGSGDSPGGYIAVPFALQPGKSKMIRINTCWYAGETNLRNGPTLENEGPDVSGSYKPWYSGQFGDVLEVGGYYKKNLETLNAESSKFSDCFYDSTLPAEVLEAVSANLSIIKSPTVLRQDDGRLWCWEGCGDTGGCCHGTCTHVWNYAQAIPHLFPDLERSLRETEYFVSQKAAQKDCGCESGCCERPDVGHQTFRSSLPIRDLDHNYHAASDGQLGGIMKVFREWKISGDDAWLGRLWQKVKESLDYCIETWDKKREGVLREPHHNTYDIEFWGADGMCSSFYLGALKAASMMARYLGDMDFVIKYSYLYEAGRKYLETELYNGEYFIQKTEWKTLEAKLNLDRETPEAKELCEIEGPKYQYGSGCISDGVLGAWMAEVCGVGEILSPEMVKSHLLSVYRYNLKRDLSEHANPQRPGYALGREGGLLLCSWPGGQKPSLPFVYSDEVWTGIEYQVASHLIMLGCVEEGLEIVRICRSRYDGTVRNPYNEYECGHFYARAMSSYGLLQAMSGATYDALTKTLSINPAVGGDFKSFISTAAGYGSVGIKNGDPFIHVVKGTIEVENLRAFSK
ncbi:MAG: non-lysosomal glucosylceramidase [Oscillospiraceae bacterium]|nr:non-lysosomal glucosylceramidase [Oscillospiraceae bacterium]